MAKSDATLDAEFDYENVVFQVEDALFRVPRNVFSTSPVFEGMFNMPQPPDAPREGSSVEVPLKLDGVRKEDFKNFLRVFLPIPFAIKRPDVPGKEIWLSALHLATMWQIVETREDAISILGTLEVSPSEKLTLADRYDVPAWVAPALLELVNREPPLSEEEVVSIGLTRALIAVGLRERRHKSTLLKMAHCQKCDLMGRLDVRTCLPCRCPNPYQTVHAPELTTAAIFVDCTEADVLFAFGLDPLYLATPTQSS